MMLGFTQRVHATTQWICNVQLSYRDVALITCNLLQLQKLSYSLNLYDGTAIMTIGYFLPLHLPLSRKRAEFYMLYIIIETVALQHSLYSSFLFPTVPLSFSEV
jgi:hypothetical protein